MLKWPMLTMSVGSEMPKMAMSSMVVLCPAAWSEKHTSRLTRPAAMHAKPGIQGQ